MILLAFAAAAAVGASAPAYMTGPGDPMSADPSPTVGVANPLISDANLATTLCKPNWTGTIRPSNAYTTALKKAQLPPGTDLSKYEEDHVRAIVDGGHPYDPDNLRPQYWSGPSGAKAKDHQVEDVVHHDLCAHKITLEQARSIIATWVITHHPYPVIRPVDASKLPSPYPKNKPWPKDAPDARRQGAGLRQRRARIAARHPLKSPRPDGAQLKEYPMSDLSVTAKVDIS